MSQRGDRIGPFVLCLLKCCVFCLCGQPRTCVGISIYMYIYVYVLCACMRAYRAYMLSLTAGWTWGHEVVAASPQMGCWIWQLLTVTVQTMSCESEDLGGSTNPFTENNNEDTGISFPVTTLEKGYEARTGWSSLVMPWSRHLKFRRKGDFLRISLDGYLFTALLSPDCRLLPCIEAVDSAWRKLLLLGSHNNTQCYGILSKWFSLLWKVQTCLVV